MTGGSSSMRSSAMGLGRHPAFRLDLHANDRLGAPNQRNISADGHRFSQDVGKAVSSRLFDAPNILEGVNKFSPSLILAANTSRLAYIVHE